MKKTLLLLMLIFSQLCISDVCAQIDDGELNTESGGRIFALVEYNGRDELDMLFEFADLSIDYFEGRDIEKPSFLGIFNKDRFNTLTEIGYESNIFSTDIDAEIDSFRMLTHQQPIDENELKPYGDVFKVTDYYYIIKFFPEAIERSDDVVSAFIEVPFPGKSLPTPLYRTVTITMPPLPSSKPVTQPEKEQEEQKNTLNVLYLVLGLFGFLALATVGIVYIKKKRNEEE